ncbi:MAG: zinc ribbon domain-containing protein [Bacteroidetes bacterium]|nr:zinc ribbon domain-containing protein [Bacteroidota bacterium]MDA1333128.1 zinc ribbon domain-containing protein [Bacteroidota bacterium]
MPNSKWECTKCNHTEFETDVIRTTGNGISRFFDIQNRKFTAIICARCGFTEFYRGTTRTLGNVLDFLIDS